MKKKDNLDFFIRDTKDIKLKTYEGELDTKKKCIERHQNDPNPDNRSLTKPKQFPKYL